MPTVHLNLQAEEDLAAIARYVGLEKQSPQAARGLLEEFFNKCEAYARQPGMGTPEEDLGEGFRSFGFKRNYVVIYRPTEGGIDVLRVVHGARDYPRLFGG